MQYKKKEFFTVEVNLRFKIIFLEYYLALRHKKFTVFFSSKFVRRKIDINRESSEIIEITYSCDLS